MHACDSRKHMYQRDLTDIALVILVAPVVYVFVTRAPVFAALIFSSLLVAG